MHIADTRIVKSLQLSAYKVIPWNASHPWPICKDSIP